MVTSSPPLHASVYWIVLASRGRALAVATEPGYRLRTKNKVGRAVNEDTFAGLGGYHIYFRFWRPEGRPKAVVVISHGFNSHSGQYIWVGEQLLANGYAVYALDHRGRGRSDGERFYVKD